MAMIYVSTIEPLIHYRVTGELVEMRIAAGEWFKTDMRPGQITEAVEAGRVKQA